MRILGETLLLALVLVTACTVKNQSDDDDDNGGAVTGGTTGTGGTGPTGGTGGSNATTTLESTCMTMCDRGQTGNCAARENTYFDHASCIAGCTTIVDMKADTDQCYDEGEAIVTCLNGLSDVCTGFALDPDSLEPLACRTENLDYNSCFADYCQDHQTKDYCN